MESRKQNKGLWAARNAGQSIAHGEFLMFVDGDDYMHLDAIRTLYQAINQNKNHDMAIIDYKKTNSFDEDIQSEEEGEVLELTQEEFFPKLMNREICSNVWNKLYRKSLIENIYANDYPRAQDFDFNIRVFLVARSAVFVHRAMYFWLQRPTSVMHQPDYWDIVYSCQSKMFYENYVNLPDDKKNYSHYLLSKLYKNMVFDRNRHYFAERQEDVFELCTKYEKDTRMAYWTNRHIPLYEKIGITMLLHNPRLTRWLMKVTKNY